MTIPIHNLYYLLCYAWDRLEEGRVVRASADGITRLVDLFGRLLVNGTRHLARRGLDRGYVSIAEDTGTIRGRIDFNTSLKRMLFNQRQAHCEFDDLSPNTLPNQILKATMARIAKTAGIDRDIRCQLNQIDRSLYEVDEIQLTSSCFRLAHIHRNNRFYSFLFKVCELVYRSSVPDQQSGGYRFRDFTADDKEMADLFEAFVFNFFRIEQQDFSVKSDSISWVAERLSDGGPPLPTMKTDISLRSADRTIIIDAKFYREVLQTHRGSATIRSAHLYQIHAYLRNLAHRDGPDSKAEGLLLYPTVTEHVDVAYRILGHVIRVRTVNLADHWTQIRDNLLSLLDP